MVGPHDAVESGFIQRLHDGEQIEGAVAGEVGALLKAAGGRVLHVAHMGKENFPFQHADDPRQIRVRVCPQGAGAQRHAVAGGVHCLRHAPQIFSARHDPGQTENAPAGIVGVNGHLHLVFFACGHDGLQKIDQVFPQLFLVHIAVSGKQLFQVHQPLRFPAGQHMAPGVCLHGGEQPVGVHRVDRPLIVGQHGGSVGARLGQVGPGPVKHGHEIVTDQVDAAFGQRADRADVGFDVPIPGGKADLDVIVDIDALNAQNFQAGILHLLFQGKNFFFFPVFARHGAIERGDHTAHARHLANLFEGDGIIPLSKPSQAHFHKADSFLTADAPEGGSSQKTE